MKKLLEILSVLGGLAGVLGIWFSYQSFRHEAGGNLTAWHQSREIHNNSTRTIFVCLDDMSSDLSQLSITPFFDNSFKYSIKDFSLDYTVESSNVMFEPTDFYTKMDYSDSKSRFRYKFETLKPYTDTEPPFRSIKIKSRQSRCRIETKATYDGASFPYEYVQDVWFLVVDKKNMSDENWRISCKNAIYGLTTAKEYDIYYRTGTGYDYVYDVNLANVAEEAKETPAVLKEQKKVVKEQKDVVKEQKDVLAAGKQKSTTSDSDIENSIRKTSSPTDHRNVALKSFCLIEGTEGGRQTLRLEYEPFGGAWVMIAWEYVDDSLVLRYGASWEYLPAQSTCHDITLYSPVKNVKQVAQAIPASGIDDLEIEVQNKRIYVTNPNREMVAVRGIKGEYTYYMVIQARATVCLRQDDEAKFEYQAFVVPFEKTKKISFGTIFGLLFSLCIAALGVYSFVQEVKQGSSLGDKLGSILTAVIFLAIFIALWMFM